MKQASFSLRTVLIIVALLVLLPTAVVLAQEIITSAEPGYVNPPDAFASQIIGDDPDEDGYVGPVVESDGAAIPFSGEGEPLDPALFNPSGELQPDDNGYTGAGTEAAIDGWSNFYYIYVAGSALRPRNSGVDWISAGSGGCMYTSGLAWSNVDVQLPEGSRVDYLRLFYFDTNTNDSLAWLTSYDGAGSKDDMVYVQSASDVGYGTTLSEYLGEVVDTTYKSYLLNWNPLSAFNETLQVCGLRIAYRLPTP